MIFIHSLKPTNILSFCSTSEEIPLGSLNVIIGPNGSGKSNLIECIDLLRSAPRDLTSPIREGGGVSDWLWKGADKPLVASLEAVIDYPAGIMPIRYHLSFAEVAQRFETVDERIENIEAQPGHDRPYLYFAYSDGRPMLNVKEHGWRELRQEHIDPEQSILSQRKDPDTYPEITYLGEMLQRIRIYREWSFGRYAQPRLPQKADLPNNFLAEDARNLGLVLNRLRREPAAKKRLLEGVRALYEGVDDFDIIVEGGTVQVFFQEGRFTVPATRLSDGTLRYLCLLVLLCHPSPPPLLCIEEPELGLHPDILSLIADLLREASERTQLIVTTHSDALVDALSDVPESVLVCEKEGGTTVLRRLDRDDLSEWLERYSLGQLWRKGELGGNRW